MKKKSTNYDLFKEAYSVFKHMATFKARKHGVNYAITIVNNITGANQLWKTGFEELFVNELDYQKIKQNYPI